MSILLDALRKAEKDNKSRASSSGLSGDESLDFSDQSLDLSDALEDSMDQKRFFKVNQDVNLPQNASVQSKQLGFLIGLSALILFVVVLFFNQKDEVSNKSNFQPERALVPNTQSTQKIILTPEKKELVVAELKKDLAGVENKSIQINPNPTDVVSAVSKKPALKGLEPKQFVVNKAQPLTVKATKQKNELLNKNKQKTNEQPKERVKIENRKKIEITNFGHTKKSSQEKNRTKSNKKSLIIKRSKTLIGLVNEGYTLYQKGEYGASLSKYSQAYRKSPNNKDALLGMLAAHAKLGQPDLANVYRKKLKSLGFSASAFQQYTPNTDVAKDSNNIVSVSPKNRIKNSITPLTTQLKKTPNDARLNFALATEYAKKNDWKNAQYYYFKAHQFMPKNPSYAFNLAVSLEHLGHAKAALNFYEKTKVLMRSSPSKVNPMTVARRLNALSQRVESGMVN